MGVVERAAQAARDTLDLGGTRELQGSEFRGDLGEDGGLGGEDASDEQGQALAGRVGKLARGGGGADALEDFLKHGARGGHRTYLLP